MNRYLCQFSVNGTRSEEVVSANNSAEAKRLVEARYGGAKVVWLYVTRQ